MIRDVLCIRPFQNHMACEACAFVAGNVDGIAAEGAHETRKFPDVIAARGGAAILAPRKMRSYGN